MTISAQTLIERFRQILGWPYRAGGTDETGIDCSGAFVRVFRMSGMSIYHGSNRILRQHCTGVQAVGDGSRLRAGMAVFKQRADTGALKAEYRPGGRYYDPDWPMDYYHIGLVESVRPLRILHATTPVAKRDTSLGKWAVQGWLKGVTEEDDMTESVTIGYITAQTGGTVNLRAKAGKQGAILRRLPIGACVRVLAQSGDWARVSDGEMTGYVMAQFIATAEGGKAEAESDLPTDEQWRELEKRVSALEEAAARWQAKEVDA